MTNFSTTYTFLFALVMVTVVALLLSLAAMSLKPLQEKNIEVEKKQQILASVRIASTTGDAADLYARYITGSFVLDNRGEQVEGVEAFTVDLKAEQAKPAGQRYLPVFTAALDNGTRAFVVPLRGKGLWGPIWGYLSLEPDLNTIYGAVFDHQGETPGLGAEISTDWFEEPFAGKKIFGDTGEFTSVKVLKEGAQEENPHAVDAISGGTITSKGLEAMLDSCLVQYKTYLLKNRIQ